MHSGLSQKQIIIVGDSHLGAIKRGFDDAPESIQRRITFVPLGPGTIVREDFFKTEGKHVVVETKRHARLPLPDATPDAVYAVSLPLNTSRILRAFEWDKFVPWYMVQNASEMPLSQEALLRLIRSDVDKAIEFVAALSGLGLDVAVVEAPMFFDDANYLATFRFDVCKEVAALYRNYVLGRLVELKVGAVLQPQSTLTSRGTTELAYNHEDPEDVHHGNARFGRVMLDELVKYADR